MPYIPNTTISIPNTTIYNIINSAGTHTGYRIDPNENYVLHDKNLDTGVINPDTLEPTGEVILGFYAGPRSVAKSYDFTTNPREFYAVLETEVPEGSDIFNIKPETEIM